jgi:hypothetical protein
VTDAARPGQWCWASQAADALRGMKRLADASLAADGTLNGIDAGRLAAARHEFRSAGVIGEKQAAARAGPLMRKHHALARRLRVREDDYLRFTRDARVPIDNNAAEREIRMGKLRIKASGCMRSMTGAQNFCAIRSCLSTAAKHGIGMLDALTQVATGTTWISAAAQQQDRQPIQLPSFQMADELGVSTSTATEAMTLQVTGALRAVPVRGLLTVGDGHQIHVQKPGSTPRQRRSSGQKIGVSRDCGV